MILSFSFSNFRSFTTEAQLFLASPSMRTNVPRPGETWQELSQHVAAIYGANASGKTTVLQVLRTLSRAIRNPFTTGLYHPHKQSERGLPTEYRIDFVSDGIRYEYEVRAANWGIEYEALFSYPKGSRRRLYERMQASAESPMEFVKGPTLKGPIKQVEEITQPDALILAVARILRHSSLESVANTLADDDGIEYLSFAQLQDGRYLNEVVGKMLESPRAQQALVSSVLEVADLGLETVEIREEKVPTDTLERLRRVLEVLSDEDAEGPTFSTELPEVRELLVFHHRGASGETFALDIDGESSGTKSWMVVAWNVLSAIRRGAVLLIDELDASLHPDLARYVVELFQSPATNPNGAQLIFTTHDISLLGNVPTRVLEPPNVWFVEKDASGTSELFTMTDFDGRRGNNNQKRYQSGHFGALPRIDESLLRRYIDAGAGAEVEVVAS